MALSRVTTWVKQQLSFQKLNGEFDNILNNALSLISPLTGNLDVDGNTLIMDADGDSSISASVDDQLVVTLGGAAIYTIDASIFDFNGKRLDLDADNDSSLRVATDDVFTMELQGVDLFIVDGSTASAVNGLTITAADTGNDVVLATHSGVDTDVNLQISPQGAGEVLIQNGIKVDGQKLTGAVYNGSDSWALNLTDANTATVDITVTGAAIGDFVCCSVGSTMAAYLVGKKAHITAHVLATNTVTVFCYNDDGTTLTVTDTVYVRVLARA